MTICFVYGTRPELIKLASLIRLCQENKNKYYIINAAQHTSFNMNMSFFDELGIVFKGFDLNIGHSSPGSQIGQLMCKIEEKIFACKPNCVVYVGDTNTVLAASLVAAKLGVPGINIEAGLRCGNRKALPEELNRMLANTCSDYLFCPTHKNAKNLVEEKNQGKIFVVGNTIVDSVKYILERHKEPTILDKLNLFPQQYILTTIHRSETTNDRNKLKNILDGLGDVRQKFMKNILFPMHPRTKDVLEKYKIPVPPGIIVTEPVGYVDMLHLIKNSLLVISDSGGIAEECAILNRPHVVARNETERDELITINASFGLGAGKKSIVDNAIRASKAPIGWKHPYGSNVGQKIYDILKKEVTGFNEKVTDTDCVSSIVQGKKLKPTPIIRKAGTEMASLIIVNFNTPELTINCVDSIKKNTDFPHEIIVVDSGSTDDSADKLRKLEGVKYIESTWNKGYGGSLNKGYLVADGKYIFFLNSDLIMTKGWLKPLIDTIKQSDEIAFVGPKLINKNNQIMGAGVVGTVKKPVIRGWMEQDSPEKFNEQEDVVMLCGACFGCKRDIFNLLGKFDERIFLYFEETLIQCLALKKGYRNVYQPESKIFHLWDKSPKGDNTKKRKFFEDSKVIYEKVLGNFVNDETTKYPKTYRLLATVIGKNEADRYLKEVLDHMSKYVDEIIFLDNGSTDNTINLVKSYPKVVKIIEDDRPFHKQEPELRKKMLDAVAERNPDWVIAIDCDEILEEKAITKLKDLMKNPIRNDAIYSFAFHHFWGNRTHFRTDGYWNPRSSIGPRMFKYSGQEFEFGKDGLHKGSIPPSVLNNGAIVFSGLRIIHLGYAAPVDIKAKYDYYTKNDPNPDTIHRSHYESIVREPKLERWVE